MKKRFEGTITYRLLSTNPDYSMVINHEIDQKYFDRYTIDTDYFTDQAAIIEFIKNDLALVAGGGYSIDTIFNARYQIKPI